MDITILYIGKFYTADDSIKINTRPQLTKILTILGNLNPLKQPTSVIHERKF
jgi:hypothetical protein